YKEIFSLPSMFSAEAIEQETFLSPNTFSAKIVELVFNFSLILPTTT
ncbi:2668_t:CDS:1, partial [Dentiscutata erythropus]